jgi:hypothetical protein
MQYFEMVPLSLGGTKKRTLRSKRQQQEEHEEQEDEERVSLVDPLGAPTAASGRRRSHPTTTTTTTSTVPNQKKNKNGNKKKKKIKWTPTRLMRYLSLTVFSALFTFYFMGRESKSLHWKEFNHLLQPELKKGQAQCYVSVDCYIRLYCSSMECFERVLLLIRRVSDDDCLSFPFFSLFCLRRANDGMGKMSDVPVRIHPFPWLVLVPFGKIVTIKWSWMRNMHPATWILSLSVMQSSKGGKERRIWG